MWDAKRRIIRSSLIWGFVLMIWTAGCDLASSPEVINHPQPTMQVNQDAPWDMGCSQDGSSGVCALDSALGALGCASLQPPGDMLGGLSPSHPMYICLARRELGKGVDESTYLYREGCKARLYVRYALWRDGEFEVLQSQEDLAEVFAPVDSPEEALSYALAVTGLGVRYGLEPVKGYRYFVDELQDSHVIEEQDGYEVTLYDYQLCGCGPHTTEAVVVHVTRDGEVQEIDRWDVYEDPDEDGLCVD